MSADRDFEATDLIEVMEEAVEYNRFLIEEVARWAADLGSVLDFGAGNGRFAIALQERRVPVCAVEPDAGLRTSIMQRGVEVVESLDALGQARFDGIYTINVLEHIEDDCSMLERFARLLAPKGRLFVYVPAFQVLFSANDVRVGHVRRYRRASLVDRVERAGFAVEDASYVDSIGFVAALGYRFLGNRDGGLDVRAVRTYDRVVFPLSRRLDRVFGGVFGKNLLVRASLP